VRRVEGIRAVTYDCWGTLLRDKDWKGAMDIRIGALRRVMRISEDEARELMDEAWSRHDEAWKQVESFGPGRMAAYCLEVRGIDDDPTIEYLTREFEEATRKVGVNAVEGAEETLSRLKEADLGLALICDTGLSPGRVVRELLDDCGLLKFLDVTCFSDEVGAPKPGNEIFATALRALNVRPPEAIHIGDLRRTDIAGAHDIGMHAARFRGVHDDQSDSHEAQIVLDRHEQILEVLSLDEAAA
jgi:putative hydrolase of the HAD superfamily